MPNRMSSRERVLAAMRRQPVDHVPCVPTFNPLSAPQRRGHSWNFPWPAGAPYAERLRYQLEVLGTDAMVPAGVSLVRSHPDVTSRTWVEDDILHKAYATPAGDLCAAVRCSDLWPHGENIPFYSDFNIGHYVRPWIQCEADLERFTYVHRLQDDADAVTRARESLAVSRALADEHGLALQAGGGMGLTGAQHLFGVAELCMMTLDNPELVDAYLEYEHRINLRQIEVLAEGGVDTVRRNGFYETADFYSPPALEQFLGACLRAEAEAARDLGMLTSYTVHTGIAPILDYLASLRMDALFGIDIAFKGLDLEEVRDVLSPVTSFFIGPSSTFHIWEGPEATREAVRTVFEVFGKTGLILGPCVSCHSIMPWESTLAMIDEWKRLR